MFLSFVPDGLCCKYDREEYAEDNCNGNEKGFNSSKEGGSLLSTEPPVVRSSTSFSRSKMMLDVNHFQQSKVQPPRKNVDAFDNKTSLYRLTLARNTVAPSAVEETHYPPMTEVTLLDATTPPEVIKPEAWGSTLNILPATKVNEDMKLFNAAATTSGVNENNDIKRPRKELCSRKIGKRKIGELLLAGWILENSLCPRCDFVHLSQYAGAPKQCINCNYEEANFDWQKEGKYHTFTQESMSTFAKERRKMVAEQRDNTEPAMLPALVEKLLEVKVSSKSVVSSLSGSMEEEDNLLDRHGDVRKASPMLNQLLLEREESEREQEHLEPILIGSSVFSSQLLVVGDEAHIEQPCAVENSPRDLVEASFGIGYSLRKTGLRELYDVPQELYELPLPSKTSKNASHGVSISIATPQQPRVLLKNHHFFKSHPRNDSNNRPIFITFENSSQKSSISSLSGSRIAQNFVISDTLAAIFNQLELTKAKLLANSIQEVDVSSQVETVRLIEKLTSAAIAVKKLEIHCAD